MSVALAAGLLVGLACLGVPLMDDACAVALVTVAVGLWREAPL